MASIYDSSKASDVTQQVDDETSDEPMEIDGESSKGTPDDNLSSEKPDANDYSRFNDITDSDSEDGRSDDLDDVIKSITESIAEATTHKDEGNAHFKSQNFQSAKNVYNLGVKSLKQHKDKKPPEVSEAEFQEIKSLLVSLHGNLAMVEIKEEKWSSAVASASEVLKMDHENVKALYRRGVANARLGHLEKSKTDLSKTIELDPSNGPAKKELADVIKALKGYQKKEKAVFSNLFSKGSVYDDKEREREEKKRREQIEREKEVDEWTKTKISRREMGLEEQTFEQWKEDKEKARKKKEEEDKKQQENKQKSTSTNKPKESTKRHVKSEEKTKQTQDSDDEYDEDDVKIIKETKQKGYCYFNRKQSEEEKNLIGDITPKTVHKVSSNGDLEGGSSVPMSVSVQDASPSTSEKVLASSWNHAGTWEERDLTKQAHDRLKALCMEADFTTITTLSETGQRVKITTKINKIDSLEGDAQIVLARNKKRHIFDFNLKLEFEVTVDSDVSPEDSTAVPMDTNEMPTTKPTSTATTSKSAKKIMTGHLKYTDISPNNTAVPEVTFKKEISKKYKMEVDEVVSQLKDYIQQKFHIFETDFKSM